MGFSGKWVLFLVVLTLASAYLTFYTVRVQTIVAVHIYEADGHPMWRTTPPGSLFPWPTGSGMFQALSEMNENDLIIYRYLVKSWVLVGCAIALWIITFLWLIKGVRKVIVTEEKRLGVK